MIRRVFWMGTGAALGVYASAKARRAAYRLSVPGLADQAAAAGVGWREFRAEVADGMTAHETRRLAASTRPDLTGPDQKELPC